MSIANNPNAKGRNNGVMLPKVGGGDNIAPSHINKLSDAASRNQLRSYIGGQVRQTNGGTVITPNIPPSPSFPFAVNVIGDYISVKTGCVFWGGSATGSVAQYFTQSVPEGGEANRIYRGGEYDLPEGAKSFYDSSVEVKNSGDDKAGKIILPKGDLTETMCVWMDVVGNPNLKYTKISEVSTEGIPIAYVLSGDAVIQLVKENIYPRASIPLQITLSSNTYEGEDAKGNKTSEKGIAARLSVGTVNDVVPWYGNGGDPITNRESFLQVTRSGEITFYLVCWRDDAKEFPFKVVLVCYDSDNEEAGDSKSDSYTGYIAVAKAKITDGKVDYCYNLLTGSLRAEAHRRATTEGDKWEYFYYRV